MALRIETAVSGLDLVTLRAQDADVLYALLKQNRAHSTVRGDYTEIVAMSVQEIADELRSAQCHDLRMGLYYHQKLVGRVDLNSPKLGTFVLGYWIDAAHTNRGLVKAGCVAIIDHARCLLGAQEIWAGVKASNSASISVLEHLGFVLMETLPTHLRYRLSLGGEQGAA